jgi:hypothetical protein
MMKEQLQHMTAALNAMQGAIPPWSALSEGKNTELVQIQHQVSWMIQKQQVSSKSSCLSFHLSAKDRYGS